MKLCQEKEKAVVLVTKILKDSLWSAKKVHFHLRHKEVILNKMEKLKKQNQKKSSKYVFIRWDSINWNKKKHSLTNTM